MTGRRVLAAVTLLLVLLTGRPAAAIETQQFGIEAADGRRLEVDLRPGRTTTSSFDLWNRGSAPLVLRLRVVPATIAADGSATLEGSEAPVAWSDVPEEVTLEGHERRTVELSMRAPRQLPDDVRTVAVLAEPVAPGEPTPAVLQRLALVAHLQRGGRDLPDLWPWAGLAVGAIAVVLAQIVVSRRRPREGSRSR